MKKNINEELAEHVLVIKKISKEQIKKIEEVSLLISKSLINGGKILLFGNGGSAADAQHIAGEMIGRLLLERESLPAIALTTNSSVVLALGNDYGFDTVFERQVAGLAQKEDVVIGISTSGNSSNVIRGIIKAKEKGAKTIALTGGKGGILKDVADFSIIIPSGNTQRIQEAHILVSHIICAEVERRIVNNNIKKTI